MSRWTELSHFSGSVFNVGMAAPAAAAAAASFASHATFIYTVSYFLSVSLTLSFLSVSYRCWRRFKWFSHHGRQKRKGERKKNKRNKTRQPENSNYKLLKGKTKNKIKAPTAGWPGPDGNSTDARQLDTLESPPLWIVVIDSSRSQVA